LKRAKKLERNSAFRNMVGGEKMGQGEKSTTNLHETHDRRQGKTKKEDSRFPMIQIRGGKGIGANC